MTRVTWGATGERYFETGLDRGVLYVGDSPGVAWPGLISINEAPSGGGPRPYYIDGFKYLNLSASEEFEATLNAFASPKEFAPCDGTTAVQNGLFATQQPRRAFHLSYRTKIGNDVDGRDHAYKIHLVYNALAGPSQRNRTTQSNDNTPDSHTWQLTTLPPSLTGMKPTAHFEIDSRFTPPGLLAYIEGILYGTDAAPPRIPMVSELLDVFRSPGPIVQVNLSDNPSAEVNLTNIGKGFGANTFARDNTKAAPGGGTWSVKATATGGSWMSLLWMIPTFPGTTYSFGVLVWVPTGVSDVYPTAYGITNGVATAVKDNWVFITHTFTATANSTQVGAASGVEPAGRNFWADNMILIEGDTPPAAYFDGDTPDTGVNLHEWVGPAHASMSNKRELFT